MKKFTLSTIVLAMLFAFAVNTSAQGKYGIVGKLFSEEEAERIYGPVLESETITMSDIEGMMKKAGSYMLFKVRGNRALVANAQRQSLTGEKFNISDNDVFNVYSKRMVAHLLAASRRDNAGNKASESVEVQQRAEVVTLQSGAYVLELALVCPPICMNEE